MYYSLKILRPFLTTFTSQLFDSHYQLPNGLQSAPMKDVCYVAPATLQLNTSSIIKPESSCITELQYVTD